jgi:hypothetical protein
VCKLCKHISIHLREISEHDLSEPSESWFSLFCVNTSCKYCGYAVAFKSVRYEEHSFIKRLCVVCGANAVTLNFSKRRLTWKQHLLVCVHSSTDSGIYKVRGYVHMYVTMPMACLWVLRGSQVKWGRWLSVSLTLIILESAVIQNFAFYVTSCSSCTNCGEGGESEWHYVQAWSICY